MKDITEADLIAAIEAAFVADEETEPGTITTGEYAEYLGVGERAALTRIKRAVKAGTLEPCRIRRTTMHGIRMTVLGYRLAQGRHD